MKSSQIRDYRDALRAIWLRSAYDRGFISNPFWGDKEADLGLRRTEALLGVLGRPHDQYKIVHVAGSKGKGSTCAFAASISTAAGYRTGTYTSPHLHSFRERIGIDGKPISERAFTQLTTKVLRAAEELESSRQGLGEVTAFELATVMALGQFDKEGCHIGVIEVGMGGTLDATNVVVPAVSVITALDYEHTKVLGSTLAEIAANKAGIIKPGRPVVVVAQEPEPLAVIEKSARDRESELLLAGRDWSATGSWQDFSVETPWGTLDHLRVQLPGDHQVQNAGAAVVAMWQVTGLRRFDFQHAARVGLANARWPGRFEIVDPPDEPTFVLDGAHTPASARALVDALLTKVVDRPRAIVLALMADKDPGAFARELARLDAQIIVTSTKSPRAASVSDVLAGIEETGLKAMLAPDVRSALSAGSKVAGVQGSVIVTGSLATVAEAREALGLAEPDPAVDDESFFST